jgi:hypothetical protein
MNEPQRVATIVLGYEQSRVGAGLVEGTGQDRPVTCHHL